MFCILRMSVILLVTLTVSSSVMSEDAKLNQIGFSLTKPARGPSVEVDGGYLVPYSITVPGSEVTIEMVPIPGGVFTMGSPESEAGREACEGPQVKIQVGPMWFAKTETTWKQYKLYMSMYRVFKSLDQKGVRQVSESNAVDAVTAPTELYEPSFTYEFGDEPALPAITMTQFSAKQYTKWLSKLTGQQYRLPTAAEWEHACRAGTSTPYSFEAYKIDEYAWYKENSDGVLKPVGTKKPNPFGLHDMHGSVWEFTVDAFNKAGQESLAKQPQPIPYLAAINWPTKADERVCAGGGFQDAPQKLRSSARLYSVDEEWKEKDPNVPLSPWWYTSDPAREVGFRIARSYQPIDEETIKKFWEIDHDDIKMDVDIRIDEGRGVRTAVDPNLSKDIETSLK